MATPIEIPQVLRKKFMEQPRIVMDLAAPGYWPIDLGFLKDQEFISELLKDREFAKTHQIVIMRK